MSENYTFYNCVHAVSQGEGRNHWACMKITHPDEALILENKFTQLVPVPNYVPSVLHKPYVWVTLTASCSIKK
jgi:hypothetical protein